MNAPARSRFGGLPVDDRLGLPIPWFVHRTVGEPVDFRVADGDKRIRAIKQRLCWCCGEPLGRWKAYLAGPMCLITCASAEPPMHRDCAAEALQICPFLSRPQMKRSPRPHAEKTTIAGTMIERNPGVTALAVTDAPVATIKVPGGFLVSLPTDWALLQFWREKRMATRAEILESVTTGLPALEESAAAEGPDAMIELTRRIGSTTAMIDRHLKALERRPSVEAVP